MYEAIRSKILILGFAAISSLMSAALIAQDSELEFSSKVTAISVSDADTGVITIVIRGNEFPITINRHTSIEYQDDTISLDLLRVGDAVEIEARFEGAEIIAGEVELLDREWDEFRLKGQVTGVDFSAHVPGAESSESVTRITVMGVDVYLDDTARIIVRGEERVSRGRVMSVDISELSIDDRVDVRGIFRDDVLWVEDIKIGDRDMGEIELEGVVTTLTAGGFILSVEGAGDLLILIDENTEIDGEFSVGSKVEVEGVFGEDLSILAFEVESDDDDDDDD